MSQFILENKEFQSSAGGGYSDKIVDLSDDKFVVVLAVAKQGDLENPISQVGVQIELPKDHASKTLFDETVHKFAQMLNQSLQEGCSRPSVWAFSKILEGTMTGEEARDRFTKPNVTKTDRR